WRVALKEWQSPRALRALPAVDLRSQPAANGIGEPDENSWLNPSQLAETVDPQAAGTFTLLSVGLQRRLVRHRLFGFRTLVGFLPRGRIGRVLRAVSGLFRTHVGGLGHGRRHHRPA